MKLRPPKPQEAQDLSALCMRSKAYWGYDSAFMDACKAELTVDPTTWTDQRAVVAEHEGQLAGYVELHRSGDRAEIHKLFVDPKAMGLGIGRALMKWCITQAQGAAAIDIESDPNAEGFYSAFGAKTVGTAPSTAIPGRVLPLMEIALERS